MKRLHQWISLGLSLALCASLAAPALAATYDIEYGDVVVTEGGHSGYVAADQKESHTWADDSQVIVTGKTTEHTVTVDENVTDATITLKDVDIDVSGKGDAALSVGGGSDVTVELDGDNSLKSGSNHAGLELKDGGSVTIQDENGEDGSLAATGGSNGAGIGGGYRGNTGDITITGGDVAANGGSNGAGIGGSYRGNTGDITITGRDVAANGGSNGAGIGGGYLGNTGEITVTGGEVSATGGAEGAGIGSGASGNTSDITISGGNVTATGGSNWKFGGAGIGSSHGGHVDNITITGGEVNAKSGSHCAGIGSGTYSSVDSIVITGGSVTAESGTYSAGIGTSNHGTVDKFIIVDSAIVKSLGHKAPIGGDNTSLGKLTGSFDSDFLGDATKATVTILDSNGNTLAIVEMDRESLEQGLALQASVGDYYVYVATDTNPEGAFALGPGGETLLFEVRKNTTQEVEFADSKQQYTLHYEFVSGTGDRALPKNLLPPEDTIQNLTLEASCSETYADIPVAGGVWTFAGWSTESVFRDGKLLEEVTLVGTWVFEAAEPVPSSEEAAAPVGDQMTRAQFVDALWRRAGKPAPVADEGLFDDVSETHRYSPAMAWAKSIGIIEAYQDGTFAPDDVITVGAAREILTRYAACLDVVMPELAALTGKEDAVLGNCGQVLSAFFSALDA